MDSPDPSGSLGIKKLASADLLSDKMPYVFFVLVAHHFEKLGVRNQHRVQLRGPGFRVRFRIVDGEFNVHVPEVAAAYSFDQMHCICGGVAGERKPSFAVEAVRLHYQ